MRIVCENIEKLKHLYIVEWEYKIWQPLWKIVWKVLKKFILIIAKWWILGIYWKELKSGTWRDIWSPKFIASLFTTTEILKQHKFSSIKKMWYVHIMNYLVIENSAICNNLNVTGGHHAKWNKSVTETKIFYDFTIWGI